MSDQQVREIQLGGKQLVFLFMASVVVAVAIFLLGVSVGRGVRSESTEVAAAPTDVVIGSAPAVPVEMPPATVTTPEDFQYHDQLQGTTPPAAAAPPRAASAEPASAPTATAPKPAAEAPKPAVETPKPVPPPGKPSQTAAAKEPPVPPASGGWFVQANAFRSRANADRQAAQLRASGYANASVASGPGGLYLVRVGPFADRAEADRIQERLRKEQGGNPSIRR